MRFTLLLIGLFACSDHTINEIKPSTPGAGETGFEDTGFRPVEPVCPIEQSWTLPESLATDLLFSLDSSCSMGPNIWELYGNFDAFVNELSNFSDDWQMMVVNKDDGCNHSGIIKPTTPNFKGRFKDALFAWNTQDDFTEALLTVNARAVEKTSSGECNQGFMRDDAMLHIIDITDEPEQSEQKTGETWDILLDRILVEKGDPVLTTVSAIAGDVPDGCDGASAGTGYAEAVAATNGVFLSICQNWSTKQNLGMLAAASVNQDTFALSDVPIEESIKVWVNGVETTDWQYDATLNAVVILNNTPGPNDEIRVEYDTSC